MTDLTVVHVLWHVRADDEYAEDAQMIGVYRSRASAEAAIARLATGSSHGGFKFFRLPGEGRGPDSS